MQTRTRKNRKPTLVVMLAALALASLAAAAADIDGTWISEAKDKTPSHTLILKSSGSKLTGQLDGNPITDGQFDGKTGTVSFSATVQIQCDLMPVQYKGTLLGGRLSVVQGAAPFNEVLFRKK